MVKHLTTCVIGVAAGLTLATGARAVTFGSAELSYDNALLTSFNLVNLGNYTSSGVTQGREVVGGTASFSAGSSVCAATACATTTTLGATSSTTAGATAAGTGNPGFGALTVFGTLTGTTTSTTVNGTVNVQGNFTTGTFGLNSGSGFNLGGTSASTSKVTGATEYTTVTGSSQAGTFSGTHNTGSTVASVFPFGTSLTSTFGTAVSDLSSGLADLPGTPGVTTTALQAGQTSKLTPTVGFTATNGQTYGVVTTTLANLVSEGASFGGVANGTVNGTTDAATFVVVTGNSGGTLLPTLNYTDPKVIYDFVNATALTVSSAFNGTILAPLATIAQNSGGAINGSLVVASINQTTELSNGNLFTGDLTGLIGKAYGTRSQVPEPASLSLMAAAAAGMGLLRRRSRRRG